MNHSWLINLAKSDYLKLVPILALAFYLVFLPHHNYPYLVHLDEWIHLSCSNEIIKEQVAFGLSDPFSGGGAIDNQIYEVGFHVFLAMFHQISGIDWLVIFKYFPAIIFILTILSAYILGRRLKFGWEAAFIACLVPTTVGILGPGFLVPVALGLFFILLSVFITFNFTGWRSYLVLFLFVFYLTILHSVTAIGLIVLLLPYILLNLKSNFIHSLGIILACSISFLIAHFAFPWMWERLIIPSINSLTTPYTIPDIIDVPGIVETYGYYPIALCILGYIALSIRNGKSELGLVLGLLLLMASHAILYVFGYGIPMLYYRGLQYAMLMMSIVAGAGLAAVKELKLPEEFLERIKVPSMFRYVGVFLCLVLIGLTLAAAIPERQKIPYYHMIDDEDYQAFIWIHDNVDATHNKAVVEPWKGAAFTAITGKQVYSWIGEAPKDSDFRVYEFLGNSSTDTSFLEDNNISIVYSRQSVNNPDLTEVRQYVYLLNKAK